MRLTTNIMLKYLWALWSAWNSLYILHKCFFLLNESNDSNLKVEILPVWQWESWNRKLGRRRSCCGPHQSWTACARIFAWTSYMGYPVSKLLHLHHPRLKQCNGISIPALMYRSVVQLESGHPHEARVHIYEVYHEELSA